MRFFTFALYVSLTILIQSWSVSTVARPLRVNKIGEIMPIKHRLRFIYNQDSVDQMIRAHAITNAKVRGIFEAGSVLYQALAKQQEAGINTNSDTVSQLGALEAEMLARHHLATEIRFVRGRMTLEDFLEEFEMLLTTNDNLFSVAKIAQMNDYLDNGIAPAEPPSHHGLMLEWKELEFKWPNSKGISFMEE